MRFDESSNPCFFNESTALGQPSKMTSFAIASKGFIPR